MKWRKRWLRNQPPQDRRDFTNRNEQRRAIFSGAWGEKGGGPSRTSFNPPLARHRAGKSRVYQGLSGVRGAPSSSLIQGGSCMRERRPYGSVGGGDQRWSSLPRQPDNQPIACRYSRFHTNPNRRSTRLCAGGDSESTESAQRKWALAKAELHRHLDEVRMAPSNEGKDWCYVATGDWDLLGVDSKLDSGRQSSDWRLEMVAGVRDVLKIPPIPFCVEMLRPRAASRFGVWVRFPSPAP
jgi:hypothetical protein